MLVGCNVFGSNEYVHYKAAIRLTALLTLRPNFTLGGHPKAFITDTNKQTTCTPRTVSVHHMFQSHKHDSNYTRNSLRAGSAISFPHRDDQGQRKK